MVLEFTTIESLRAHHPAWRLLRSDHAPLIISFLHRAFVATNVRGMDAVSLAEALEDDLYALRLQFGDDAFPRSASEYLDEWAAPDKGWLRKFYRPGTDEAQFDLTPASEKAIGWLAQLAERQFVGTESRLLTLFDLLRQMSQGTETDPERRLADLQRKRDEINAEIQRIQAGDLPMMDDTALKDRFLQFTQGARELLADFREVEHNFRKLDRHVRERIALWAGSKGELLEEILGEHDAITDSDQGRSFRAFWEFLLSSRRQEELSELLGRIMQLPAVQALQPDPNTVRIHHDWLEAGEHTQRTVATLSRQLRRFLDDRAWMENRRIMEILHDIESHALALRESPPRHDIMTLAQARADVDLPLERPLYAPPLKPVVDSLIEVGEETIDPTVLFDQHQVDRSRLIGHIRRTLQGQRQATLQYLIQIQPIQDGLAELLTYLHLKDDGFRRIVDESTEEPITWTATAADGSPVQRTARLPRVVFSR